MFLNHSICSSYIDNHRILYLYKYACRGGENQPVKIHGSFSLVITHHILLWGVYGKS